MVFIMQDLLSPTPSLHGEPDAAQPFWRMEALAERGRTHRREGDLAAAHRLLADALVWARCLPAPDAAVELLCDLTELATQAGPAGLRAARSHAHEAARLAGRCADPLWEVHVLLRVSDALAECGDHAQAIGLQCRALALIVAPELASQAGSATAFGELDAPRM